MDTLERLVFCKISSFFMFFLRLNFLYFFISEDSNGLKSSFYTLLLQFHNETLSCALFFPLIIIRVFMLSTVLTGSSCVFHSWTNYAYYVPNKLHVLRFKTSWFPSFNLKIKFWDWSLYGISLSFQLLSDIISISVSHFVRV